MSEVRLVVREADRDWSGTIHGSCADRAIAALSADPVTMDELEAVYARFAKRDPDHRFLSNLRSGLNDEPYDAGLVIIDLVARLVVVDSTYSSPGQRGHVEYHNGKFSTDKSLSYHLADDWHFSNDGENWRHLAEERRRERAAKPELDSRAIFYGRPMLEFVARETFAAFARRDAIAAAVRAERIEKARQRQSKEADIPHILGGETELTDEAIAPKTWPGQEVYASPFYDTLRNIHASWLLTPRDDLGGVSPRQIALERRGHLSRDEEDRCHQWSVMGQCPPGLVETSHAYRYGGFGTHELVMYYELIRELLWSCWNHLGEMADESEALVIGNFHRLEVPRLECVRDAWFDAPNPEFHGRTPRSIIARERARLPEGMSGHHAIVDPDCPCCQMMADMPGPMFWHLDGSGMDDDFAFDIYRHTREEWDAERREWDERSKKFNAEWAERQRLGVTDSTRREDGSNAVWSRSFFVNEAADVPLGIRVFGIGCRLAELIAGVRSVGDSSEAQSHIDQLNRDFGNLRELLQGSDSSLAAALIDPVIDRFSESLNAVATTRPDLRSQCESLVDSLHKLLSPPAPDAPWDPSDSGLPF